MIRFIDIGDQICEGNQDFAFFDTVTMTIMAFDGEQVFGDVDEFKSYFFTDRKYKHNTLLYDRLLGLIPDEDDRINFPNTWE